LAFFQGTTEHPSKQRENRERGEERYVPRDVEKHSRKCVGNLPFINIAFLAISDAAFSNIFHTILFVVSF